jgi:hypothetical protein
MLIYEGVDPAGGTQYSRYDRNRVESVFKQAMAKEEGIRAKHPKVTTFQMNLANCNTTGETLALKHSHNPNMIIAEKVQKRTPQERNTEPEIQTAADKYGKTMIRHLEKYPWQKMDLPQTRAQEIGWLVASSMQSQQFNKQRSHSTGAGLGGQAKKEAYRTSSLAQLSGGNLGVAPSPAQTSTNNATNKMVSKSSSEPQLPRMIPHLPDEGARPECATLNNPRWRKPKNGCAITDYADKYYAVMRLSPFASLDVVAKRAA